VKPILSILSILFILGCAYATIEGSIISIDRVSLANSGAVGNGTLIEMREQATSLPACTYASSSSYASHVGFFEQQTNFVPPNPPSPPPIVQSPSVNQMSMVPVAEGSWFVPAILAFILGCIGMYALFRRKVQHATEEE
jgi:hypothetical protein